MVTTFDAALQLTGAAICKGSVSFKKVRDDLAFTGSKRISRIFKKITGERQRRNPTEKRLGILTAEDICFDLPTTATRMALNELAVRFKLL